MLFGGQVLPAVATEEKQLQDSGVSRRLRVLHHDPPPRLRVSPLSPREPRSGRSLPTSARRAASNSRTVSRDEGQSYFRTPVLSYFKPRRTSPPPPNPLLSMGFSRTAPS